MSITLDVVTIFAALLGSPDCGPTDVCLIAFGDQGTLGSNPADANQLGVARAMNQWQERNPTQFVLGLGDNFYTGVGGVEGVESCDSIHFADRFEKPYRKMPQTFYMTLGNHDRLRLDFRANRTENYLCYARRNPKWYMPKAYYTFRKKYVEFFAIDTAAMDSKQLKWLDENLTRSTARWKIVFGHHTIFSHGKYKNNDQMPHQKKILNLLKRHSVDLYLSGHDHNQQHLVHSEFPRTSFVISGAGGKALEDVVVDNPNEPATRILNRNMGDAEQHGFAYIKISGTQMDLKLVSANDSSDDSNGDEVNYKVIHTATLADKQRAPGRYSYRLEPIENLCPYELIGGDREFHGNGPRVKGRIQLGVSPDGSRISASIAFKAKETKADWSEVSGEWTLNVGEPAPPGMRFTRITGPTVSSFDAILQGGGRVEPLEGCDGGTHHITVVGGGPVNHVAVVGDTGGGDISDDNNCHCDTRVVSIDFAPVNVELVQDPNP